MPLNVRRFCTSVILSITALGAAAAAQTIPQNQPTAVQTPPIQTVPIKAPTSAEIMRDRISKAKAFIAVRNYNAAIYELENIRRETSDPSVQAVSTVLLMNSYLEQGDYKRAQDFLTETFNAQKANRPGAAETYSAVAGQVVKGARTKVERYRALGLMVSDRTLPLEAVTDIERMRETVELVITQAKENGKEQAKAANAMALLEEATTSRTALARDDYDAKRWTEEVADSREQLANSRSVITNAVDGTTTPVQTAAVNNQTAQPPAGNNAAANTPVTNQPVGQPVNANTGQPNLNVAASNTNPPASVPVENVRRDELAKPIVVQNAPKTDSTASVAKPNVNPNPPVQIPASTPPESSEPKAAGGPLEVGSLVAYATTKAAPVYPPTARSMRAAGVVKVEVMIDENGQVAEVQGSSGPVLLQSAAKDAVRKWRFKPFVRDGQPVRATGFVSFNFTL